jgi:hypothetical protein
VNTVVAGDPAIAASIKAGRYSVAVEDLNSVSLQAAASRGVLTPALRGGILAFEVRDKDKTASELIDSHRYIVTQVLPYTTNTAGDPAGIFVIWSVIS